MRFLVLHALVLSPETVLQSRDRKGAVTPEVVHIRSNSATGGHTDGSEDISQSPIPVGDAR